MASENSTSLSLRKCSFPFCILVTLDGARFLSPSHPVNVFMIKLEAKLIRAHHSSSSIFCFFLCLLGTGMRHRVSPFSRGRIYELQNSVLKSQCFLPNRGSWSRLKENEMDIRIRTQVSEKKRIRQNSSSWF